MAEMTQGEYDELRRDVSEVWLRDNLVGAVLKKMLGYHANHAGLDIDDEHETAIQQEEQHRITTVPADVPQDAEASEDEDGTEQGTQENDAALVKSDSKTQANPPAKEVK